ncbi:MAG: ABC transporter substrate-binding protein [Micrococcales bacterium]|nr:ABC transporter substrate-binding protein [Micrococcales bacterium]
MRLPTKALALGAAAALALAGCSSSDDKADNKVVDDRVEVFTWWSTGSEARGLEAMVAVFDSSYPDVTFVDVAAAGGATQDRLQSQLAAGDPPDSFQAPAGKAVQDYVAAGQVQAVSDLYDELDLRGVFPRGLVDLLTVDGQIYSVPSNVHRANLLWASLPVLEQAGLSSDVNFAAMDDFVTALEQVRQNVPDVVPLSIGTTWTQVHLLEVVLIAELGPAAYTGLWDGSTDWTSAAVTDALGTFETLMSYTNTDRDGLDWEEPHTMLIDNEAAFNIMVDWAPANYEAHGVGDYAYAPAPGTAGVFDCLADSFTLTTDAPHPAGAKAWLRTVASQDGQTAFSKVTGSIPARTDIDPAEFSTYQQTAITSLAEDVIVPSLQHGAAATPEQVDAITAAVSKYTTGTSSLSTFQSELAAAMK